MRIPPIWFVVLLLAVACTGDPSDPREESTSPSSAFSLDDAFQPDEPLLGVAFTGHVDRENPKVHPRLAFTTADTEVTAVIGLGDVDDGSTVVVSWYRVVGLQELEALFSHEIAVGPGGLAFSQAIAPNGLAPGIYDTAATMDGHVVHTPWVVREGEGSETSSTSQPVPQNEDGHVPASGHSWVGGTDLPPPPGISQDTCTVDIDAGPMIPMSSVPATAWWVGPCTAGTLTATVSGPPTTLASSDSLQGPVAGLSGTANACHLSGGSDLPGTVVHLEATGSASGSRSFTLPDYGEFLAAALEGLPKEGSRVEPGDRIDILAIALVMSPALGVRTLYVDDGSDLLESVGNLSGSDQPVACNRNRLNALIETAYEVPSHPPPVIELCATALGFDGTESKSCIQYFTGEVWKGTANVATSAVYSPEASCQDGWELEFTFGVSAEGTIEGQGTATLTSTPTCNFPIDPVPWIDHHEYQVLGEETAGGFSIRFSGVRKTPENGTEVGGLASIYAEASAQPVEIAVSGNSGTGQGMWQFQSGVATLTANGTITLECVASCEEPGG